MSVILRHAFVPAYPLLSPACKKRYGEKVWIGALRRPGMERGTHLSIDFSRNSNLGTRVNQIINGGREAVFLLKQSLSNSLLLIIRLEGVKGPKGVRRLLPQAIAKRIPSANHSRSFSKGSVQELGCQETDLVLCHGHDGRRMKGRLGFKNGLVLTSQCSFLEQGLCSRKGNQTKLLDVIQYFSHRLN